MKVASLSGIFSLAASASELYHVPQRVPVSPYSPQISLEDADVPSGRQAPLRSHLPVRHIAIANDVVICDLHADVKVCCACMQCNGQC